MSEYGCNCDIESVIFLLTDSIDENKKPIFTNFYFVIQSTQTTDDLCQIPCHIDGRLIRRSNLREHDLNDFKQLCDFSLEGQIIYLFKIDMFGQIDPHFYGISIIITNYQYTTNFSIIIDWRQENE